MSALMRKHHTSDSIEIIVNGTTQKKFIFPRSVSPKLFAFLRTLKTDSKKDDLVPSDQVFKSLDQKYGKIAATIRGFRVRDGLTQVELAEKLHIHQTHISQIERGKRTVGKKLAQKLAKVFNTDYRLFL